MQKHDLFKSPGASSHGNGYNPNRDPNYIDPNYEYYEYEEEASKNSFDLAEEEYMKFL